MKKKKSNQALPERPNLLLILTDQTQKLMHFPKGWEEKNLPANVRLRKHGLSFTNAFCNSCMCTPSRATVFTGLYPAQHGVTLTLTQDMNYSDAEPVLQTSTQNLSHMLASAGYHVSYLGKWHLSKDANNRFDDMTTEDVEKFGYYGWVPPDAGQDANPDHFGGGKTNYDLGYANQAINFLNKVQSGQIPQPFALVLSLVNPHDVLSYPNSWKEDYSPAFLQGEVKLPETVDENLRAGYKPTAHQLLVPYLNQALGKLSGDKMKLNYLNFYGNLLKHVDAQVNTVLDVLYQVYDTYTGKSLADDTLVIKTSDHGEMGLTHHALRQKIFNCYEETMRVPFIVSNPKLFPRPAASDQFITLVDLLPTLNGFLGLGNPLDYDFKGVDMSELITDKTAKPKQKDILFTFDDFRAGNGNAINPIPAANRIRCIREQNWKYARYFYIAPPEQDPPQSYPDEFEMYDLKNDPYETNNLAHPDNPDYHKPRIAAARKRLEQRLAELEVEKLARIKL